MRKRAEEAESREQV